MLAFYSHAQTSIAIQTNDFKVLIDPIQIRILQSMCYQFSERELLDIFSTIRTTDNNVLHYGILIISRETGSFIAYD